jgi:hypothetical protein
VTKCRLDRFFPQARGFNKSKRLAQLPTVTDTNDPSDHHESNMKQSSLALISAAVVGLFAAGGASAQLTDVGTFGRNTVSSASSGYTPGRNMQWSGGATFQAYCIDPHTGTGFPGTYSRISLDTFTNGTATSEYASQVGRSTYSSFGLVSTATAQTQVRNDIKELFGWAYQDAATTGNTAKAAAFGLALWEIVMQNWGAGFNSYSRTTGTFTSTGGDTTSGNFTSSASTSTDTVEYWLDQYLRALNGSVSWTSVVGASATLKSWDYTVYFDGVSPVSQTFISVTPSRVSAPATVALAGLGLLGVMLSRRKPAR